MDRPAALSIAYILAGLWITACGPTSQRAASERAPAGEQQGRSGKAGNGKDASGKPRKLPAKPSDSLGKAASGSGADRGDGDDADAGDAGGNQRGSDAEGAAEQALADPATAGPYRVQQSSDGLNNNGYASATLYWPEDGPDEAGPALSLVPGYSNSKEDVVWMAEHFASHGYVVLAFTPTSSYSGDAGVWARGHEGALASLQAQSQNATSPIAGRVDPERLGVVGFSMGGAGAILAANANPEVKTMVALCAYRPQNISSQASSLLITGTADTVAEPGAIEQAYTASSAPAAKALLNIDGLAHSDILRSTRYRTALSKYMTAYLGLNLAGKSGYKTVFEEASAKDGQLFSRIDYQP